jgi:uridine phosphorylase
LAVSIDNVHRSFGGECESGDIAPYVLLPTSARQAEKASKYLETARKVAEHYEFSIYTGEFAGAPVSVCSTGIGGMSVSIAMEELARLGAETFLHVGLATPLATDVEAAIGLLTIAQGAVRLDGTSDDYARPEYPAIADFEVVMAAVAATEALQLPYRLGIVASGLPTPSWSSRLSRQETHPAQHLWTQAGVFGGSGEEATIFVQASLFGLRAGSVTIYPTIAAGEELHPEVEESVLEAGLEALHVLALWDLQKRAAGVDHIVPSPLLLK